MVAAALVVGELVAPTRPGALTGPTARGLTAPQPIAETPVGRALERRMPDADGLRFYYSANGWRPLFVAESGVRPEARAALGRIGHANRDGLDPGSYHLDEAQIALDRAISGDPDDLADAELKMARAWTAYIADLRGRRSASRLAFVDPRLRMDAIDPSAILAEAGRATSLGAYLQQSTLRSAPYEAMRAWWEKHGDATPEPDRTLFLANLERLRFIPANSGARLIVVDAAGARLQLWQDGKIVDTMPVGVGKVYEPTPEMAGLIRYAMFQPYWNIPPDLVRDRLAPQVVARGLSAFTSQHLEVLSDWSASAHPVDPAAIDWTAAASGKLVLRVRQKPGPDNMMGKVKFMLPNPLGVYLHDTPLKALLKGAQRTVSAGCVRLSDAGRLARTLLPGAASAAGQGPEQRVDLAAPVPVFITYLTLTPEGDALDHRADVYGRDLDMIARIRP